MQDRLQKIPFQKVKIDSLTLLIPYDEGSKYDLIANYQFTDSYTKTYISTGENESSEIFYNGYIKIEHKEQETFLKYKSVQKAYDGKIDGIINRKETRSFIQVMITSKLLKDLYFEGINIFNIGIIYDRIIEDQIIRPSKEQFLNAHISDIDICRDFKANIDDFKRLKDLLVELVVPGKESVLNRKRINSKDLFGIQYNERHKATPSKPFAKLYFKSKELLENSNKFYEANLKAFEKEINEGIARFEVTIKAYKHKERLNIKGLKTLNDLLCLPSEELERIYNSIVAEYYEVKTNIKEKNTDKMKTSDLILLNGINELIKYNPKLTTEEFARIFSSNSFDKGQRYEVKKKVENAILISQNRKQISANDEAYKTPIEILKTLGIFEG